MEQLAVSGLTLARPKSQIKIPAAMGRCVAAWPDHLTLLHLVRFRYDKRLQHVRIRYDKQLHHVRIRYDKQLHHVRIRYDKQLHHVRIRYDKQLQHVRIRYDKQLHHVRFRYDIPLQHVRIRYDKQLQHVRISWHFCSMSDSDMTNSCNMSGSADTFAACLNQLVDFWSMSWAANKILQNVRISWWTVTASPDQLINCSSNSGSTDKSYTAFPDQLKLSCPAVDSLYSA